MASAFDDTDQKSVVGIAETLIIGWPIFYVQAGLTYTTSILN